VEQVVGQYYKSKRSWWNSLMTKTRATPPFPYLFRKIAQNANGEAYNDMRKAGRLE